MASSSLPTVGAPDFYQDNGYFYQEDADIGNLVPELEKRGLAESFEGLEVAKPKLLANQHAHPILGPYLDKPDVRLCITLGPDPDHRFVLSLEPGQKDRIIVHLLSPGSYGEVTQDSHRDPPGLRPLRGAPAANGLIEVPSAAFRKRGSRHIPIQMGLGGVVIHDRRLSFRIIEGSTIIYDLHNTQNTVFRDIRSG